MKAMPEVRQTEEFEQWHAELRDRRAAAKVAARIDRLRFGNWGDVKPVGEGVSEIRIDYGPGYRLYAKGRGNDVVVLLCGGDKTTQQGDIERAKQLARDLEE